MLRHSALETLYKVRKYSTSAKKSLTFKEIKNIEITQIICWPEKIEELNNFLINNLNIKMVPSFNKGIVFENKSLWRMEPLKWWLFNKEIKISDQIATTLDISHAYTSIEIKGDNSTLFLNRHLPIDLRTKNFPNLSSASTAIHHVSVKLFKISSNNYCLYIPRGFALSIWEILLETADQFGYEVLDR
tara:strand:+ start:654 stop:1217 length:564 start_codon:yes stop_codon:yes gene_type:complete